MSVQYQTNVPWDATLIDLEYTDSSTAPAAIQGLVKYAIKVTTGAPAATAGKFIEGAIISNAVDSNAYMNTGTTASPTWTVIDVAGAGGITELTGDVTAGPGNGAQAATIAAIDLEAATLTNIADTEILIGTGAGTGAFAALSGDVTMSNAGVTTVAALDLESATVTNIADTEILIGTGAGTAAFAAMSGDATMSNAGVVTVTGATGAFEAGGAITNAGGTLAVGFIPTGVTSPQALTGPGAANTTTYQTQYTSTGAGDVVTLADATRIGHLKKISYVAEGGAGDTCVVTPTNLEGFTTATLAGIGDYVLLMWNGANWLVIEAVGATLA